MKKEDGDLKILLSNFEGTVQQKDIEKRTSLIEQFFRTKVDVPAWEDPNFDWSNEERIMQSMVERFDMPSWALYRLKSKAGLSKELKKYNRVFIYQIKGCNLHCPYCYVDDVNKNGIEDSNSRFFSIEEILQAFLRNRTDMNNRIRPSGGEPTLVPEQWLNLLEKLEDYGLSKEVHIQSDTNLTTGHFIDELAKNGEIEENLLEEIAGYGNFSLLASFKGTDPRNFVENTRAPEELFEEQFYSFGKFIEAGIDAYPFLYNPNPKSLEDFMDRFEREFGREACKKVWVFPIKMYDVPKTRLENEAKIRSLDLKAYVKEYEDLWSRNFTESEEIMRGVMKERFGLEYKRVLRVG
ncbi:MAG: radical SAM protein [Candidatus Aenigmatarchaeota archaeon]